MDSGNNSSSLQSSSGGGGDEEFDSRTFFATNINASATNNANSNGFSISNNNTVTTTTTATTNNNNNNFPNFLDNFSFLVPASSSFPLLLDPRSPPDDPAPAKTAATPANRPSTTLSSSPRSTTSSRKRSRASRRAPTTVLTTDTSNFRAMVQEFTGIPSPPFASSSSSSSAPPYPPPPRPRFDFFNPALSAGATPSPLFLLKPYPHKPFHFPNAHATTTAANINYLPQQPPSSSNFGHNNSQSLLQSQLGAMPSTSTAAADYGSVNVGDLGQLTGAIGSGWGQDAGVDPTSSLLKQATNGACKLNYSAVGVAAEFGAEKGGEARGEGMVESWICSSD